MANILLIGTDEALLEGLVQTLAAVGHAPRIAHSLTDAATDATHVPPLITVIERAMLDDAAVTHRVPVAPGGALLIYHTERSGRPAPLPRSVQRLTLAELTLPLERQRLVALVQHVEERAMRAGRDRRTPPESHRSV